MLSGARRHSAGLTLIEVAVTISLIALLAMWVAPDMRTWIQNTQIRGAAESIASGLARARSEALRNNRSVSFTLVHSDDPRVLDASCAASDQGMGWVVSVDAPDGLCHVPPSPSPASAPRSFAVQAAGDGYLGVRVSAVDAGANPASAVRFDGFGRITGAQPIARIDLGSTASGSYRELRLVIHAAGSVRMCEPAVTDNADPRKC